MSSSILKGFSTGLALVLALAGAASARPASGKIVADPDLDLARKAALQWLALLDTGKFDASFDEAATSFQKVQKKDRWSKGLGGARATMGTFVARAFSNEEVRAVLPSMPPGKYVTVRFKTVFAKHKEGVESVTLVKDGARGYRTIAYFLG